MSTAQLQPTSFRLDPKTKKAAAIAADRLSISLNTVVNAMLKGFAEKPQLMLTENGFTPIFETKVLAAKTGKYLKHNSKTEFLSSLKKQQKKSQC